MSVRTSTSKRSRRSATPVSAIFSLTRTFNAAGAVSPSGDRGGLRRAGAGEDLLRARNARAEGDVGSQFVERHLEPRDRGQDGERAVRAAVRDARDLALQVPLAAGGRDAELVPHQLRDGRAVDSL